MSGRAEKRLGTCGRKTEGKSEVGGERRRERCAKKGVHCKARKVQSSKRNQVFPKKKLERKDEAGGYSVGEPRGNFRWQVGKALST